MAAIPVSLGDRWAARLAAQAEKCGLPASYLARVLLLSGIEKLEAGGRIVAAGAEPEDDGTRCKVTPLADGLARLDITMPNDSRTLANVRALAAHAGVTPEQWMTGALTKAALDDRKTKQEPLTLPENLATTIREAAAVLGREPQSFMVGFLRQVVADLGDPTSGLLAAEIAARGGDAATVRRFKRYCAERGVTAPYIMKELREAQRKAA